MKQKRGCRSRSRGAWLFGLAMGALALVPRHALAAEEKGKSLLDLVAAGGPIIYVILAISVVGVALIVHAFMLLRRDKLAPPALVDQTLNLTKRGRFQELLSLAKTNDSLLGRVVGESLEEGHWGLDAVREGMEQVGKRELTRLHQRVNYIGFIASIAPMLGLLGTVTGMINSFDVLGEAKGAARPSDLAVGIAEALMTTCMGLIVAVPLMFFHTFLRDRVTRAGQDMAAVGEKMLRMMAVVIEIRNARVGEAGTAPGGVAPQQAQPSQEAAITTGEQANDLSSATPAMESGALGS